METNLEAKCDYSRIEKRASSTKEIVELFLSKMWREMMCRGETTMLRNLVREYLATSVVTVSDVHDILSLLGVSDYSLLFPEKNELLRFSVAKESSFFRDLLTLSFVPGTKKICSIGSASVGRIVIPDSVEKIGSGAFMWMNIHDLVFPSHIKEISASVCYECRVLESVILPEGLKKIDAFAFQNCHSLKEINIPSTLTSIGDRAFGGCEQLPEDTRRKIIAIGGERAIGKDNTTREKQGDDN